MAPIDEKMRTSHLRWFGHIQKIAINAQVRRMNDLIQVKRKKRGRGGTYKNIGRNSKKKKNTC